MKAWQSVVVLLGVQLLLIGVYLAVEGSVSSPTPFLVEALDEEAPALAVERGGVEVEPPAAPHLVHFWATWCAPCQEELPGLVAAAASSGVPLIAVTDEPWPVVQRYFDDDVPVSIVRDPSGEAAQAWRVSGLPDTFVVRGDRVVGRMGGPRAWHTPEARAYLRDLRRTR